MRPADQVGGASRYRGASGVGQLGGQGGPWVPVGERQQGAIGGCEVGLGRLRGCKGEG